MNELLKAFETIKEFCDSYHCADCPLYLERFDAEKRTMCMADDLPCNFDIDDISMKLKSGET